jgi:uncharacterized protein (DUF2147 family)
MKIFLTLSFVLFFEIICAQSVFGKWKTIDDITGVEKSIVQIYEENGKVYGKVLEIFDATKRGNVCTECKGALKNKPILGMVILFDLKKEGDEYVDGTIIDPKTGKEYDCYIVLENKNTLKVRGYMGFSIMGRTQLWKRHFDK